MKTSTLGRNGVSTEMVDLIGRLIDLIEWPARRRAMGDVTMALLDGKRRVAEDVFGWNRKAVELGIHEYQTGIACINDVGEYSRGGRSRGVEAVKALDHDMCMKEKLVPGGILEPVSGKSFLFFGTNYKTGDFMADGLLLWWQHREPELAVLKQLVINLDNGPECNGRRSQFLLRMTEFADLTGLCVRLVYYPPYHSKYNAIERYWAGLEKSWNGYLLSTVDAVINRAGNFCWKGMHTMACLVDAIYEKGVKLFGIEKRDLEQRLERSEELNLWDITIHPKTVRL